MDLSLKDFLPLIGTILTVFAGYMFLTVQVRKNRRAKWIEDFRREAGHIIWLLQQYKYCEEMYDNASEAFRKWDEIIATAVLIQLFLDRRIKTHEVLYTELSKIRYDDVEFSEYSPDLVHIGKLIEIILSEEQAKI